MFPRKILGYVLLSAMLATPLVYSAPQGPQKKGKHKGGGPRRGGKGGNKAPGKGKSGG
jgi:hypothetical protein